ncbi:head GIN domain-containing protein [Mucilaginibacter litoreus]|uniref:Head GIN domain-containing protein n=1 Tax=Mucilaginibacter litoreus TaxID=1048221 RepID=A0ABW3AXE1_9SPHI
MKTLKTFLMAGILVAAAGVAKADVQDRHLSGFNAVSIAGSYDVYITQGSSESVKVDAPSDIIDKIVTEVEGGVLKIHTKNNTSWNWSGNKKMIIYVGIKNVNAVSLAGSGDVYFKDGLKAPSLKLKLTGSGDISGKVDVKNLESSIGGSGDITVSGRADNSVVSVVGSGDFTGQGLATQNTQVKVAGSGDARINASEKIEASVVGSGDIHYTGAAKDISSSKAGSGSVSRM